MASRDVVGEQAGATWVRAAAFVSSGAYAALLTTRIGRRIERDHTWFVVMIGVFITLGWLSVEDRKAASRTFSYFVATGLPIIVRALYLYTELTDAIIEKIKDSGNQA